MQPEDLGGLRLVADPRLHPDGRRVAFTVARLDLDDDRYHSEVWLWDGEETRPFTRGPFDRAPRWSPDGTRLAFLRKGSEEGARPQVAVIDPAGGEAVVVTDFALGAEDLEWSPDGSRLAVVGVAWTDEWADLDEEERARRPRRVDRIPWRVDDRGWVHDRRRHLYLVDPDDDQDPRLLTEGDFDEEGPVWRPDGRAVAFLSARQERRGLEPGVQAYQLDLDTGRTEELAPTGFWRAVSYRPDGVPHLVGHPDQWAFALPLAVWRREEDGSLTDLTGHLDRSVLPLTPPVAPAGPRWVAKDFVTVLEDRGRLRVVRVSADGTVRDLIGGDRAVLGADPDPVGERIAFVATSPADPGELWWWERGGAPAELPQPGLPGGGSPGRSPAVHGSLGRGGDRCLGLPAARRGSRAGAAQHPRGPGHPIWMGLLRRVPGLRRRRVRRGGLQPPRLERPGCCLRPGGQGGGMGIGGRCGRDRRPRGGPATVPSPGR